MNGLLDSRKMNMMLPVLNGTQAIKQKWKLSLQLGSNLPKQQRSKNTLP